MMTTPGRVARLSLDLLGGFSAQARTTLSIHTKKNRALLAILALSPHGQATRERLADMLWGGHGEAQARSNLRQSLAVLRKELGKRYDSLLRAHDNIVEFTLADVEVDVLAFRSLAASKNPEALKLAASLYKGELLSGLEIKEAAFEDWLAHERRSVVDTAARIFEELALVGPAVERVSHAKRLLELDPLREGSYRALMSAYAAAGELGLATKQYEVCRSVLGSELNAEPSLQTHLLLKQITAQSTPVTYISSSSDRPSVAILPFKLLSEDISLRHLSDTVTEDITMEVSKLDEIITFSNHSVSVFRSGETAPLEAGQSLGASHVVTGSLRVVGDRMRLGVEVSEVNTGRSIWSERFDVRNDTLSPDLDQLVQSIAIAIANRIASGAIEGASKRHKSTWTAHDCFLLGRDLSIRYRDGEAALYLDRAVELDTSYAMAFAWRAQAYVGLWHQTHDPSHMSIAEESARRALALDEGSARGHHAMGLVRTWQRRYGEAGEHYDAGLRLRPSDTLVGYDKANWLTYTGNAGRGLAMIDRLLRRDPFPPSYVHLAKGLALFQMERFDEAVASFSRVVAENYWQHAWLAAAYARQGQRDDARHEALLFLSGRPESSATPLRQILGFETPEMCEPFLDGLRLAGVQATYDS